MNVGKNKKTFDRFPLYVDGWKLKESTSSLMVGRKDTFVGGVKMKESEGEKYLGQTVSSDGSNSKHICDKANKAIGIGIHIHQILSNIMYGRFHFEVAIILRDALLIGSMLSSAEVLYNLKDKEIKKLQHSDEIYIRNLYKCSRSVPIEMLYLDLAILPASWIIRYRRILYLHHILKQKEDSLIYRFLISQLEPPIAKGCWGSQVIQDLKD